MGMQTSQAMFIGATITHVDSDSYGCPFPDLEVIRDSLGNHHCSCSPFYI